MKKRIIISVVVAALILAVIGIAVYAAEPADGPLAEAKFGAPEALDGKLDKGWDGAKTYVSDKHGEGTPTEINAEWKAMYDNTNLYFFIDVTDSTIGSAEQEGGVNHLADLWTRNTVHIMLDMGYERSIGYDTNDFYIDINVRDYFYSHYIVADEYVEYKIVLTDKGYSIEAAIDFGLIRGFEPKAGDFVGLDIWACDSLAETNGRVDFVTWSGNPDTFCNPSLMGSLKLLEKDENAKPYDGVIKGDYITDLGATVNAITNAIGKDVSIILDGDKRWGQNVDTFGAAYTDDSGVWFGVEFGGEYEICQVVFVEGGHWGDGGWFGSSAKVQVYQNDEWKDVEFTISREYPGDSFAEQGFTHEAYIFNLAELTECSKVRVIGNKNSFAGHVSICELEVYGHKTRILSAESASCTKDGKTEGTDCEICGKVFNEQTVIPSEGHKYDNNQDASCNVCGETREVTPAVTTVTPTTTVAPTTTCAPVTTSVPTTGAPVTTSVPTTGAPTTTTGATDGDSSPMSTIIAVALAVVALGAVATVVVIYVKKK